MYDACSMLNSFQEEALCKEYLQEYFSVKSWQKNKNINIQAVCMQTV